MITSLPYIILIILNPLSLSIFFLLLFCLFHLVNLSKQTKRIVKLMYTFLRTIPFGIWICFFSSLIIPLFFQKDQLLDRYITNISLGILSGSFFYVLTSHVNEFKSRRKEATHILIEIAIIKMNLSNTLNYDGNMCEKNHKFKDILLRSLRDSNSSKYMRCLSKPTSMLFRVQQDLFYLERTKQHKIFIDIDFSRHLERAIDECKEMINDLNHFCDWLEKEETKKIIGTNQYENLGCYRTSYYSYNYMMYRFYRYSFLRFMPYITEKDIEGGDCIKMY